MIVPANQLTGIGHSAFSTNHLTDTDSTKHNYNQEQRKKHKQSKTTTEETTTNICTNKSK